MEELYRLYLESSGVCTDTRKVKAGELFFALRGPTFNGNLFADEALEKGASFVVIDEPEYKTSDRHILTKNSLKALQELALWHRQRLNIPIIAIAGSNGKTTTKELIYAVLKSTFNAGVTQGNLNNEIGVPLTLLSFDESVEYGIVEMGARHRGDIAFLCDIAEPTHGIITNAGKDHMETFKTLENVIKTNGELFRYLIGRNGTAFIRKEYNYLLQEAKGLKNVITYGENECDCQGSLTESFPFVKLNYTWQEESHEVASQLPGSYNFENILAAICIGRHFGVTHNDTASSIGGYVPRGNRSQLVHRDSNIYIMDAYNANPTSMKVALDSFSKMPVKNKIAVMGDMLELGSESTREHADILDFAAAKSFDKILLVGPEFAKVKSRAGTIHFNTTAELRQWLQEQEISNTHFLVKGSRGIALEKAFD